MNSKDRVLAAFYLEQPDRVPLHTEILDISCEVDDLVNCSGYFFKNIKSKDGTYISEDGRKGWALDQSWYLGGSLTTAEKVNEFELPDPSSRVPYELVEKTFKKYGEKAVAPTISGIFGRSWYGRGFENFVVDMYRRPHLANRLLDLWTKWWIEVAKILIDLGAPIIRQNENLGAKGGPLISPLLFRKFILPRTKKLVRIIRSRGAIFWLDSDGNNDMLLSDLASIPIDGLSDIEQRSGMNLERTKTGFGEKFCLIGNMDIWYSIPQGSVEDMERDIRRCIREGASEGGYILGPAASNGQVKYPCSLEKQKAIVRTARKYGKYPCA